LKPITFPEVPGRLKIDHPVIIDGIVVPKEIEPDPKGQK
jgi:hypothetical protein